MEHIIHGKPIGKGQASGKVLASGEALSFWGGYDCQTGEIIDRRHPLSGAVAASRVLALPLTRGSSTTTAVLLEAVRLGTSPAAILTDGVDIFLALASIIAEEIYHNSIPVIALESTDFESIHTGDWVVIREGGILMQDCPH